jgi:hypothetical protein
MYFDRYSITSLRYIDISFKNLSTVVASRPVFIYLQTSVRSSLVRLKRVSVCFNLFC